MESADRPASVPVAWGQRAPVWQSSGFWLALASIATAPFWFTELPPLGDLFNHIGRYYVVLNQGDAPSLQQSFKLEWAVIPNLGQDLLVLALGPVIGVERAAIVLTAAIPFCMVLLIGLISRDVHGSVQPVALLALPFVYPMTFSLGFVNFHTGVVVCLGTILFWLRSREAPALGRYVMLGLAALVTWLCHASAWAILVVGIGALELADAFTVSAGRLWPAFKRTSVRLLPVAWPIILFALGPEKRGSPGQAPYDLFDLDLYLRWYWLKVPALFNVLRDQSKALDYATSLILFATPAALLLTRRVSLAAGLAIWAGGLFILYWVLPPNLMGGYYADFRLLSVVAILALLACRWRADARGATAVAMIGLALFILRLGVTANGWAEAGDRLETDLAALEFVPNGARIAAASPEAHCEQWRITGYTHVASLAIARRNAFVNTQWDLPGQQVMQPNYLPGSAYNSVQHLAIGAKGNCGSVTVDEYLARLPRDKFDYVWLFRVKPPRSAMGWLRPVYTGPNGRLYAIAAENAQGR